MTKASGWAPTTKMTRSPSTMGAIDVPQTGTSTSYSATVSFSQTTSPVATSRQKMRPVAPST